MVSNQYSFRTTKIFSGILIISIFYFFCRCSTRPKTIDPSVKSSSFLVVPKRKMAASFENLEEVIFYVKASNTEEKDRFGYSLSLSADGNTLAVGAFWEDSSGTGIKNNQEDSIFLVSWVTEQIKDIWEKEDSGAVYVFIKNQEGWVQQAYIKASNTDEGDYFGISLGLSADGNTLAVGAHGEDSNATGTGGDQTNNDTEDSGAVYIFARNDEKRWTQQEYIKASNTDEMDYFGISLGLSADGNTLAVGAFREDGGVDGSKTRNSGAVYIFAKNDEKKWIQQEYIKASNEWGFDEFGYSLSLSADGNTLAVGAHGEDSNATGTGGDQTNNDKRNSGAVYIFAKNDEKKWIRQEYIKASNTEEGDEFGYSLGLSADGNTLAVGAHGEDSNATGTGGDQTNNDTEDSGAVYIFARNDEKKWIQQEYIKASNTEEKDRFGYSLSLSADGNTLAVGASEEDSNATGTGGDQTNDASWETWNSGAVYIFAKNDEKKWIQKEYVKATNSKIGDGFGYSLSLSADGNTLAVGAPEEDSNATGIGGDQTNDDTKDSGAVYIYSL